MQEDEEWSRYYPSSRYSTAPRFVRASLPSASVKVSTSGIEVAELYKDITSSTASTSAVTVEDAIRQDAGEIPEEEIRCEACKVLVKRVDWKRHVTGLGHQFAKDGKARIIPPAHFQVSGIGRQMLETMDWNGETGLGLNNQGRLGPIPTRLKDDKLGIGLSKGVQVKCIQEGPISLKKRKQRLKRDKEKWTAVYSDISRGLSNDFC